MIARASWFGRRKYGGWGVTPKAWQGWVYLAVTLGLFAVFQSIPVWQTSTRIYVTIGWALFLIVDLLHVMLTLRRDEREHKIEALAERNAAWFMVMVLTIGLLYEIITSALREEFKVNAFIVIALLGGALVKSFSNIILERKRLE